MIFDNPHGPLVELGSPPEEHLVVVYPDRGFCYKCDEPVKPTTEGECPRYVQSVKQYRARKAFTQRR